jgi:ParB-like chromosome segregation protein Spo0J
MQVAKVKINSIKTNPKNPRLIKDDKFKKLVTSIKEFPDMLNKRPLIVFTDVDDKYVVLGGNMRLKACKEIGIKEIPIIVADEWTEEQKNEFLIKDNVGFGEWDWDSLANEWDTEKLDDWGLDLPILMNEPSLDELIGEEKNKPASMKITFKTVEQLQEAENDIQELIDRKFNGAFYSVSAGEL